MSHPNPDTPPEDWREARRARASARAARADAKLNALLAPAPLPEGQFPQGRTATYEETLAEISMIAMLRPRSMHDWEMIRTAKVECLRLLALHHGAIQARDWKLPKDVKGLMGAFATEYERITGKKPGTENGEEDEWTKTSDEPK